MYIYSYHEDHSLYVSREELAYDQIYCDTCGDCDELIGEFTTKLELRKLITNLIKERGYDRQYIKEFLKEDILPYFKNNDDQNKERSLKPQK